MNNVINEDKAYYNLCNVMEVVLRGTFIALNAYIKKTYRISNK